MSKKIFIVLLSVLGISSIFAQNGSIKGTALGPDSIPLMDATISVPGTSYGAYSDENGEYEIRNVKPGTYNVLCFDYDYGDKEIPDVVVNAGETTELNIVYGEEEAEEMEGFDLVFEIDQQTEEVAIAEVKEEVKVVEVVSSSEFSKKGDSKAADAVKRVSGASVVGGKYVFVRGLSDRYSKTLFNGNEIPGLDPNRNAVQLDLFPSSFLSSIKVVKTFAPDLPADFTGGLVDIRSKDYPDSLEINVGLGLQYNTMSSFKSDYLSYEGSNTDWMGFDNGKRDFPEIVNENIDRALNDDDYPFPTRGIDPELNAQMVESFNSQMAPKNMNSFTNYNFSMSVGNKLEFYEKDDTAKVGIPKVFGYFGGINYRRTYEVFNDGYQANFELTGNISTKTALDSTRSSAWRRGTDNVLLGGLANFTYKPSTKHTYKLNILANQSGQKRAEQAVGFTDQDDFTIRVRSLQYLERNMLTGQLIGEHRLDSFLFYNNPVNIDWRVAHTSSGQTQPDLRFLNDDFIVNSSGDTTYGIHPVAYAVPTRYVRDMSEINDDVKLDLTLPIDINDSVLTKLKFGGSFIAKNRDFTERRIEFRLIDGPEYSGNQDDVTDPEIVSMANVSELQNTYEGNSYVAGGYIMNEAPVLYNKLDVVWGARFERTQMEVISADPNLEPGELEANDLLPSVNLIYSVIKGRLKVLKDSSEVEQDMKVRLSYNRTLARPNFREIAPYAVDDFILNAKFLGNPALERSVIDNFDARWEFYPRAGELVSVSAFYKMFDSPIELFTNPAAANTEFQFKNAEENAILYGAEIELRKDLNFISEKLENYRVGVNATYSFSQIAYTEDELEQIRAIDVYKQTPYRPMSGQSPWLINSYLQYSNDSLGVNVNVALNYFSDRLSAINTDGTPNIYEKGRASLDFNVSKEFGDRLKITFRAQNLLNPAYKFIYKFDEDLPEYEAIMSREYVRSTYDRGRTYKLSVSYKF